MSDTFFYTSVEESRNRKDILVRGYRNGRRFIKKVPYKPYLFVPAPNETNSQYRNHKGRPVKRIDFDNMRAGYDFIKEYKEYANVDVMGMDKFSYLFIYDTFKGEIQFDPKLIMSTSLDIETRLVNSKGVRMFPDIADPDNEITSITLTEMGGGDIHVFSTVPYRVEGPREKYYRCDDEKDLLARFIEKWDQLQPDLVTGWNIEFFDIPYLVNRIIKVLGEGIAKMLSPWGVLNQYEVTYRGRTQMSFTPLGVNVLDYMALYKKFSFKNQESWTLEHICQVELGEGKIDHSMFSNLDDMLARDPQLYIRYNIRDTTLVERLEEKMGFIALVQAFAYDAKVNYSDTLATVRPWDVIIHNYLMDRGIVIPQFKKKSMDRSIVGGFVKDPKPRRYKWVCSFDLNSLYPHLIMMYNISPDTYMGQLWEGIRVDEILNNRNFFDGENAWTSNGSFRDQMNEGKFNVTPNGAMFSTEVRGFLADIMGRMYDDRKVYQNQMKDYKKEFAKTKDDLLLPLIARFHNLQLAKKIQLNAGYGAIANQFNRWFELHIAEGITTGGQLSIKWIERAFNDYLNKVLGTKNFDYVIAIDTDSCYISFEPLVERFYKDKSTEEIVELLDKICSTKMQDLIDTSYTELGDYVGAFDGSKMKMKRESIAETAFWTAKKRYAMAVWDLEGIRFEKPEIKATGLEMVKSSTPTKVREAMKEAIKIILTGEESDLHTFVDRFYNDFLTMPFADIAFPRGVSNIDQYEDAARIFKSGTPQNSKAAIIYNHYLIKKGLEDKYSLIFNGDKIKYVYLRKNNPFNADVIGVPDGILPREFGLDTYIDREAQFTKSFEDPISVITDIVGWSTRKVYTLESFFG